ncbi:MAG: sterol desaturase family protein [Polyangiales bacterium]
MQFAIGGVIEWLYYRRGREGAEAWKCQPRRWPTPAQRRSEILLGAANMTVASVLSGLFAFGVATGRLHTTIYFDRGPGIPQSIALTVAYFLATDLGLYSAHRWLHRPRLFRAIHRWHHKYTSPTPFTASAMHPAEFFLYQSVMALPLFVLPIPLVGLVTVLLYQNYVALIDHSGVRLHSWLPWQPPTQFHDDHHVYFHVNYGQNLGLWDRLFGTWRRHGRRYGAEIFGGRGATISGARDGGFVDYGRRDRAAEVTPAAASERSS